MPSTPNILLICSDQLRADALGSYGNTICKTPHSDTLAAAGVTFDWAFTPCPICVPARATITTGNYPHVATGSKQNTGRIRDGQSKLAEHFAACGYRTYACGKLHYAPYSPPGQPRLLHGFQHADMTESGRLVNHFDPQGKMRGLEDYIDYLADAGWAGWSRAHGVGNNDVRPCPTPLPQEHHVEHWVADRTIQRMREHTQNHPDQPFLIWCSFPRPHQPVDPPYEYVQRYDMRKMPPPIGDPSMLADRDPSLDRRRYTHALDTISPAAMKLIKAYYYAMVTFQDEQIGRVLTALRQTGQAENTIIMQMADHGEMLGDFGTFFKTAALNGASKIPLIIHAPGIKGGQRRRQIAGLQDVLPTLADLAGCPLPQAVHGMSLRPILEDPAAAGRNVYYGSWGDPRESQSAMLFDGRWKYGYSQQGPTEELYDLQDDPQELRNLASEGGNEVRLAEWRRRLIGEAKRLGDTQLVSGDQLPTAPLDRSQFPKLPVRGVGWRWF